MRKPPAVPNLPMRALRAFESAGRHLSFSRAAKEIGTAQPSVSRHIAELERVLAVPLFRRHHRSVSLTAGGELFLQAVSVGLRHIEAGATAATALADDRHVVIACGHSVSQQFMLPRFEALRQALNEDIVLRVLTLDYHLLDRLGDGEADLLLTYDAADSKPEDRAVVFTEAVTPVCAPDFAAAHADVLARPVTDWSTLPFLDLVQPSRGWATWSDWFEVVGHPEHMPVYRKIENYVFLLETAVAGHGLALGWRHFVDRYIEHGTLIAVRDDFVEFDHPHFAVLTARGGARRVARRCLTALRSLCEGS